MLAVLAVLVGLILAVSGPKELLNRTVQLLVGLALVSTFLPAACATVQAGVSCHPGVVVAVVVALLMAGYLRSRGSRPKQASPAAKKRRVDHGP